MNQRKLTSSRYSPGNLSSETLERLLVGRQLLVEELTQKIHKSVTSASKHYMLLVGPRGVGKTHLIALVNHRIYSAPAFSAIRRRFLVAYLNEEEWGVASFLDFLLVILRSLRAHEPALEAALADIQLVFESDADRARDAAEDLLIRTVGKRTLVLLCENLSDLFGGLGAEGQARWRAMMQQHPFWCVLATTPSLFFAISRQTEPFYGFFTIRNLESLSFDAAVELLRRKAELEHRPDLARFIATPVGRARIRAIHHIAGGNHRAYIVLSDFLTRETLDELVSPFLQMVDDLTPYYQERMRQITSPLQRKLVDFLCRQRRPLPVREIARGALVQQQSAAKQLGELAKAGIVQRTPRGRESYYELAEPLMRICIEVKDNRTEYIRTFVDLLRHWFSARDLEERAQASDDLVDAKHALHEARGLGATDLALRLLEIRVEGQLEHWPEAIAAAEQTAAEFPDSADANLARAWALLGGRKLDVGTALVERVDLASGSEDWARRVCRELRVIGDAVTQDQFTERCMARFPDSTDLLYERAHALVKNRQYEGAEAAADRLAELRPDDSRTVELRSLVRTSAGGLAQGWALFDSWMEAQELDEDRAAEQLAALFMAEVGTRSPTSLFNEIRDKLPWSNQLDAMVARAIIVVLALLVRGNVRNTTQWSEALRTIDDVFHKAPKTRMAVRMLATAVRFLETHQIGDLLELPLEQRNLLLEELTSR